MPEHPRRLELARRLMEEYAAATGIRIMLATSLAPGGCLGAMT